MRIAVDEFLCFRHGLPLIKAPGSDGQYSNEGYVLLAAIIEKG